jgi:antitoxin VapB
MGNVITAKLFRNGGSQAVRLPAEFRFEGVDEVQIWRDPETGNVVLSARKPRLTIEEFFKLCDELGPLDEEDIAAISYRDQGPPQDRDPFADWSEADLK